MVRIFVLVSVLSFVAVLEAADPKPEPFQRLGKAELEKLAGKWELAIDTKSGWKGKLVAKFKVAEARDETFYLNLQYDGTAQRGQEQFGVQNAPGFPVQVAAYSQANANFLVVNAGGLPLAPEFDPNAKGKKVSFKLDGDSLAVNAAEGYKSFAGSKAISDLDLPWGELKLKRVKD